MSSTRYKKNASSLLKKAGLLILPFVSSSHSLYASEAGEGDAQATVNAQDSEILQDGKTDSYSLLIFFNHDDEGLGKLSNAPESNSAKAVLGSLLQELAETRKEQLERVKTALQELQKELAAARERVKTMSEQLETAQEKERATTQ